MSVKNFDKHSLEKLAEDFLKQKAQGKFDHRSLLIEWLLESCGYTIFPVPGAVRPKSVMTASVTPPGSSSLNA